MADKLSATDAESLAAKNGANPSDGGKHPQKSTEQLLAEHKIENERKAEKIASLEESIEANNSRIAELEEKSRLTEAQKAELDKLNRKNDSLESQIDEVEHRDDAKGWIGAIDKRTAKAKEEAKEEARHGVFVELQKDYLEEKSDELGVKYADLIKEIRPFSARYEDKNPLQKAKLAVRDYLDFKKYKEERADFDKKKKEADGFSEKDGNISRTDTLAESIAKGDKMAEMKSLGL